MPVKSCTSNGKKGYKYGDSGKCYTGPDAKAKAKKQGVPIEISKHADTPAKKAAKKKWRQSHSK